MVPKRNGIFSFYIHKQKVEICDWEKAVPLGPYWIFTEQRTPVEIASEADRQLVILGLCIDVISGQWEELAKTLLAKADDVSGLIEMERTLGGKYVIFYREGERCFCLPDATCSIPVFYSKGTDSQCSSHKYILAKQYGYQPDEVMKKIRKSGDVSQAMPYDYTEYSQIRQLIPNHYLSLNNGRVIRFVEQTEKLPLLTPEGAALLTGPMLQKLSGFYLSQYEVCCALTAGRDSRVVLAALREQADAPVFCYTIRHDEHDGTEQDLTVPCQITQKFDLPYKQIADESVPQWLVHEMDGLLGKDMYSQRTLKIAYTIYTHYRENAVINGDIIGQVGKCSLHRDIPQRLATPGYFRCKLHNYSKEAKQALALWLKEIGQSGEQVSTFDLFSVENRMGRWAAQENVIYNSLGQLYLNIFNSRAILYPWTRVDRGLRKNSAIHLALIKQMAPELAEIEFEKNTNALESLSKSSGMAYYLSSYLKFWIQRFLFTIKRGRE